MTKTGISVTFGPDANIVKWIVSQADMKLTLFDCQIYAQTVNK
jgi:hypothetical protein